MQQRQSSAGVELTPAVMQQQREALAGSMAAVRDLAAEHGLLVE